MGALVTGLAEELTVAEFVITTGAQRLLVMELLGRETTVTVVRTPAGRALTRAPGSLSD